MSDPRCAALLGLGLMGGSLARALAARGVRVLAHDRDARALDAAVRAGVVHAALPASLAGVEEAELVVLAVPVTAAPALLRAAAPRLHPAALLTDLGSTKRSIVAEAVALGVGERFVGSHPLAGSHLSGWEAARADLYAGARVFLSPTPLTAPAALESVRRLWLELGARPEAIDAAEHDRRLAWTSHLPQSLSTCLARALAGAALRPAELGPGGRDMTRLAGSSPEVWSAICLDNAPALEPALAALEGEIAALRASLRAGDPAALHGFFAAGREWAEA